MVADEADRLGASHILFQVINIERRRGIHSELGLGHFKNPWLGFHDARLVGVDAINEERREEIIFLENMIVVDASDIGEKVELCLPMQRAGPLKHRGVDLKDPCPELHEVVLGSVMGKGLSDYTDELLPTDSARLVGHPVRVKFLDRGCSLPACVGKQGPLRNEVVEGQQNIADVEDDSLYFHGRNEGQINMELTKSGKI